MKYLLTVIFLFTCAALSAQVNLVKNPSLEQYTICPDFADQIKYANFWSGIDSFGITPSPPPGIPEYCNSCGTSFGSLPSNGGFYQFPRTGNVCHSSITTK